MSVVKKMMIALVGGLVVGIAFLLLREQLISSGNEGAWTILNKILFQDITAEDGVSAIGLFYIIGQLFMRGLQLAIVPLVLVSLSLAMCSISSSTKLGRIAGRTLIGFFLFYVCGAFLAGIVAYAVKSAGFFNVTLPSEAVTDAATLDAFNPLATIVNAVPACSVRLHDRGVFTWKECKGLNRLTETELELEKACGWHLILGDRVLIECEKILQMRTYQFIYPAELENRARSAVIHMNAEEFTGCFQKFMKYGRIEVHSPQELREVCIRFAYAIINTAKECGTLRDEELMVQRVLKTILGAVSWEEIEAVMMELFSSIEISQINQTSSEYLVQKALTIMKECYSDGITLEETARRLHVTEQYLGTQLKKETGTSFTETVRKFKIMHVKELLLDTDLKLNQIAAMTGFSNPKYMSKVFKQEEGMLPNEYRRINA